MNRRKDAEEAVIEEEVAEKVGKTTLAVGRPINGSGSRRSTPMCRQTC
jgi:hypothetical protein